MSEKVDGGLSLLASNFLSLSKVARAVLLPSYLQLPIPSSAPYYKAKGRFVAFPHPSHKLQSSRY